MDQHEQVQVDAQFLRFTMLKYRADQTDRFQSKAALRARADKLANNLADPQGDITSVSLGEFDEALDGIEDRRENARQNATYAAIAGATAGSVMVGAGVGLLMVVGNIASLPIICAAGGAVLSGGAVAFRGVSGALKVVLRYSDSEVSAEIESMERDYNFEL